MAQGEQGRHPPPASCWENTVGKARYGPHPGTLRTSKSSQKDTTNSNLGDAVPDSGKAVSAAGRTLLFGLVT